MSHIFLIINTTTNFFTIYELCSGWGYYALTHWGLVTSYGDRDLGQHWLRWWLVAWRHQAITWTNMDLSSAKSSDILPMATLQEIPQPSITKCGFKMSSLKFNSNPPRANGLTSTSLAIHHLCCVCLVWEYIHIFGLTHYIYAALKSPNDYTNAYIEDIRQWTLRQDNGPGVGGWVGVVRVGGWWVGGGGGSGVGGWGWWGWGWEWGTKTH